MAAHDLEPLAIGAHTQWDQADEKARKDLVDRCDRIVKRAVTKIPPTYRKDVAHDAWVRVFSVMPHYERTRASIDAVVQGCARLAVWEFWRQYYRDPTSLAKSSLNETQDSSEDVAFFTRTDDSPELLTERLALLRLAVIVGLGANTPPHQAIVFAYKKLLDWTNEEIISKREWSYLCDCGSEAWTSFMYAFPKHRDWCDPIFRDLLGRLDLPLARLITSVKSREPYTHLLDRLAKETRIGDYFERNKENHSCAGGLSKKDKSDQLAHWWLSVRRRILEAVAGPQRQDKG